MCSFLLMMCSKFYDVLQSRVDAYFRDNNIPKQGSPMLWIQAFHTIFFFFLFMYVVGR